jgi:hypothetical protein
VVSETERISHGEISLRPDFPSSRSLPLTKPLRLVPRSKVFLCNGNALAPQYSQDPRNERDNGQKFDGKRLADPLWNVSQLLLTGLLLD